MNRDQDVLQNADSMSFAQLGLLVGSFMFWEEDHNHLQPQRLEALMEWTLNLPAVSIGGASHAPRLGVSASGFAHIYDTLLRSKEEKHESLSLTQEADKKTIKTALTHLSSPAALTRQDISETHAYRHFEPYIDQFAPYVQHLNTDVERARLRHRATGPRIYIWLDDKDSKWWMKAIRKTLDDFLQLIREKKLTPSKVERFGEWLECSVFAPLDILQPLPVLGTAADEKMQKRSIDLAEKILKAAKDMHDVQRESYHLYLSWDLFAFDFWNDEWRQQLVHRTVLALWRVWPKDIAWAPMPPKEFSSPSTNLEEAAHLLKHLLPQLRRYFLTIKDAHHLSINKLIFDKPRGRQVHYPATFYFADPIERSPTVAQYVKNKDVQHLISMCIGYFDQHANVLAWSTLEGSVASVRGEMTQIGSYKASYLLLPIVNTSATGKAIGSDLDYIVDLLTFLEYTIGLEAEDLFNKVQDIESKRAVDSKTIETVDYITRKLANVVSTLPGEALKEGAEEFAELQLLLGRAQYGLEKIRGEAEQIERQYDFLVNRTNEYLRQMMLISTVPDQLPLTKALMDAYPYRYLQSPMKYVPVYTAQLANSIERIRALLVLLSTAINNDVLKRRELMNRRIQEFAAILAAAALLVALPTFFPNVNAQALFKLFGYETIYNANTGIIALVLLVLTFLTFLLWFCVSTLRHMPSFVKQKSQRDRFREYVRKFWNLADYTAHMYKAKEDKKRQLPPSPALHRPPPDWFVKQWDGGRGADDIDSQATSILQELWPFLDNPSQASWMKKQPARSTNKQQASKDLIAQVQIMSRLLHVFVLRPDLVPLPRALCILRYKCLQFLDTPTISDNDFRDALRCAGFTLDEIKSLQNWLTEPQNQEWIKDNSIEKVATALKNAHITAHPPKGVGDLWQRDLSRYISRDSFTTSSELHQHGDV